MTHSKGSGDAGADEREGKAANRSATLNDALRRTFVGGRVVMTAGVAALTEDDRQSVIALVQAFDSWTPDNDPYGDHDYGSVEHAGVRYLWKIEAYDLDLRYGSPDPDDPAVTCRVLTILRADEY